MSDIRDKIKKLLALAGNNSNENEAARAMELASELMMRHGIDRAQLGDDAPKVIEGYKFNVDYPWYRFVVTAAAELYGVRPLYQSGGDVLRCRYIGRSDNIDAAQDTLAFLLLQVEALYKAHLPRGLSKRDRAEFRKSFKAACAARVFYRAREIVQAQTSKATGTALLVLDHRKQLESEADDHIQAKEGIRDMKALKFREGLGTVAGYNAGGTVDLNRSVDSAAPLVQHGRLR